MSWWIRSAETTLTEVVSAPPRRVRGFYVDLNNIRLVHPLVVCVRTVECTGTAQGYLQTFRVTDRIPLGLLQLRTTYTARLCVPKDGEVRTQARQFPMVRLHGVVSFNETDDGTRVTEHLRIDAPRGLAAVTIRQAVRAHTTMLSNIREHFA